MLGSKDTCLKIGVTPLAKKRVDGRDANMVIWLLTK